MASVLTNSGIRLRCAREHHRWISSMSCRGQARGEHGALGFLEPGSRLTRQLTDHNAQAGGWGYDRFRMSSKPVGETLMHISEIKDLVACRL